MAKLTILYILFISNAYFASPSFVFHENTRITFTPSNLGLSNEYFGYSTLLTHDRFCSTNGDADAKLIVDGSSEQPNNNTMEAINNNKLIAVRFEETNNEMLFVGAPKATNRLKDTTGVVFICSLQNLDSKNITCDHLGSRNSGSQLFMPYDLRTDMWFGSSMALLTNERLLITAPRAQTYYDSKNLLLHGAGYCLSPRRSRILDPLADSGKRSHQAFITDGVRRQYGPSKTHLYFYAQGQVGLSLAVTKLDTIVLGAPGLLQWTGGIVTYSFNPNDTTPYTTLQPIVNPYYTIDLEPDDYFGYSVESGIFEKNGSVLYVAGAPRYNLAGGKVLVFHPPTDELKSLDVRANLMGPKLGSYFGATLRCLDINEDGLDDLLVGAPTFVRSNDPLHYDQGAVFIYITKESSSGLIFEESGYVYGSGSDGARFGTAIADLGDINGDGFRDVAIGAPWEDDGRGAVYVYMGHAQGLKKENVQRIQSSMALGFGWSIANGVDIDQNKCNDLAIGAFNSRTSYLYRCIPTMPVHASIRVANAVNLPHNETTFTVMFCVSAPKNKFRSDVKLSLIGTIQADPEDNRAMVIEDSSYSIMATPDSELCDQRTIYVNLTADLLKPMHVTFKLEADELMKDDATTFLMDAARLSDESILNTSVLVQLMRDCGDDLFCSPWLDMTLEAMDTPYVPGSNQTFGIILTVVNEAEPAYGLKVNISLPMHPKRIPGECSFLDLMMACDFPQPFLRNEKIVWEIELDYNLNVTEDIDLYVVAKLSDVFYRNISHKTVEEMFIKVTPEATFSVSGKSMPNASITVLRDSLSAGASVSFKHYFEITNLGPSDWPLLTVQIIIPEKTNLSSQIEGCEEADVGYECMWTVPAMVSYPVSIPLVMDLDLEGEFLAENITYNATSSILISSKYGLKHTSLKVTTTLILEPANIVWFIVTPCIFVGLFLLAIIVRILHKRGFFLRKRHEMLQREKENQLLHESTPEEDEEHEILETDSDL